MSSSPLLHWMLGVGYPEAEHSSTASVPSWAVTLVGRWRKCRFLLTPGSATQCKRDAGSEWLLRTARSIIRYVVSGTETWPALKKQPGAETTGKTKPHNTPININSHKAVTDTWHARFLSKGQGCKWRHRNAKTSLTSEKWSNVPSIIIRCSNMNSFSFPNCCCAPRWRYGNCRTQFKGYSDSDALSDADIAIRWSGLLDAVPIWLHEDVLSPNRHIRISTL